MVFKKLDVIEINQSRKISFITYQNTTALGAINKQKLNQLDYLMRERSFVSLEASGRGSPNDANLTNFSKLPFTIGP